jgi:hypothetical protein
MLHYRSEDKFNGFDKDDLKHYERFIEVIKSFQRHYELEDFSLREIDIFLWLAGKECFPRTYRSAKATRPTERPLIGGTS